MKVLVNAKNICYRILQIGLDILHPCVGNHELPSKIVDMASMKLNYAMHFYTHRQTDKQTD